MIYRAIAWLALRHGVDVDDETGVVALTRDANFVLGQPREDGGPTINVNGHDITSQLRIPEVDRAVSHVSRMPGVRQAVLNLQRRLADEGEIIMLGRDIGTVVLPDAPVKVYLDASAEVRARRRYAELKAAGAERPEAEILAELRERDEMDRGRHVSPLKPADDALVIDTAALGLEEVVARVREAALSRS